MSGRWRDRDGTRKENHRRVPDEGGPIVQGLEECTGGSPETRNTSQRKSLDSEESDVGGRLEGRDGGSVDDRHVRVRLVRLLDP